MVCVWCRVLDLLQQHITICFNFNAKLYLITYVRVNCLPICFTAIFLHHQIDATHLSLRTYFVIHPRMRMLSQNQLYGHIYTSHHIKTTIVQTYTCTYKKAESEREKEKQAFSKHRTKKYEYALRRVVALFAR